MEIFTIVMLMTIGIHMLKLKDQRRRVVLLGSYLGKYQIEKMMETLTQGYARALGEADAERQAQILTLLKTTEQALSEQFSRFATDFSSVTVLDARVSKIGFAIPSADKIFPATTFDMRKALDIHAQGMAQATAQNSSQTLKSRAFNISAEFFLMQHTCHWFCRSKTLASARMLARHKTSYAQLVSAVSPETRRAYVALTST